MYQLVTVLLKLGQVAFSSAGSWWTLAKTARSKLLANSASPEVALTLILDVHRAEAGKAWRTTVGTSWSASSLYLAWDRVASAVCRGLSLSSGDKEKKFPGGARHRFLGAPGAGSRGRPAPVPEGCSQPSLRPCA